jgi:uncharacterized protein
MEQVMAHGDITHVEIPVEDNVKATAFYGAMFGWEIKEIPGMEEFSYPMWQAPNKISGGALVRKTEAFASPRSYVEVDSIDDILAKVVALGGAVLAPKQEIDPKSWWAAVTDPDGNEIGLYESTPNAG